MQIRLRTDSGVSKFVAGDVNEKLMEFTGLVMPVTNVDGLMINSTVHPP